MKQIFIFFLTLLCLAWYAPAALYSQGAQVIQQGSSYVNFIDISPNNRYLFGQNGTVMDIKKGVILYHGLQVGSDRRLYEDNQHILSIGYDTLRLIDYSINRVKKVVSAPAYSYVSNDGKYLLYCKKDTRDYVKATPEEIKEYKITIDYESIAAYRLKDLTDSINDAALLRTKSEGLHLIELPGFTYVGMVPTSIKNIDKFFVENGRIIVTEEAPVENGTGKSGADYYLQTFEIANATIKPSIEKRFFDRGYHKNKQLSPSGNYLYCEEEEPFILEISTWTRLKSVAKIKFFADSIGSASAKFSKKSDKMLIETTSTVNTAEPTKLTLLALNQDKILYQGEPFQKAPNGRADYAVNASLEKLYYSFLDYTNYATSGESGYLLHLTSGRERSFPDYSYSSFFFTDDTKLITIGTGMSAIGEASLRYYNLKSEKLEKTFNLKSTTATVLGYSAPTNSLLFQGISTFSIKKFRLSALPVIERLFSGDTLFSPIIGRGGNLLVSMGYNSYKYDPKTMKVQIDAYLSIRSMETGKEIHRIQLPPQISMAGYPVFDLSGRVILYNCMEMNDPLYRTDPYLFQIDSNTNKKVDFISGNYSFKAYFDEGFEHVFITSSESIEFKPKMKVINKDYLSGSARLLMKVKNATKEIEKIYRLNDTTDMEIIGQARRCLFVLGRTHTPLRFKSALQLLLLDYDLNRVASIDLDQLSSADQSFDQYFHLIVREKKKDFILLSNLHSTAYYFTLPGGALIKKVALINNFLPDPKDQLTSDENLLVKPEGLFDLEKGKMVLYWTFHDDDSYIITTPENYYHATKGLAETLRFTKDNASLPFRQYDLIYNRPDLVLARMPEVDPAIIESYHKAYLKRLQKMDFREADLSAEADLPMLKVNSDNLPFETDQPQLPLAIDASDPKFLLDRINVWVNDVPVYGRQGISLRGKNLRQWQETLNIPLSAGENQIQISCLNEKGLESLLEDVSITCNAPARKPDLYVLAIGVSEYADRNMNLNYAAKDAGDVISLFQAQKEQYGNIYSKTLINRDATAAQVQSLKAWLAQTKTDDRVILFISGHGLLDDQLDYFFATYDVDFAYPKAKGIPYDALEDLLDGIPARQKLILMDACHSGELDKENVSLVKEQVTTSAPVKFRAFNTQVETRQIGLQNSFELMKELFVDLRRSSGATVISSAGGAEYAIEGDAWKNGVFTYSLIGGLRDKAADLNNDGSVMVSELQDFLGQRVSELTQGRQRPTFRAENVGNDWRVW